MNKKFHEVEGVEFAGPTLILKADNQSYRVSISEVSERLGAASEAERNFYRVSPSGYGIHWPEIDEDLTIDGLIKAAQGKATKDVEPTHSVLKDSPPN